MEEPEPAGRVRVEPVRRWVMMGEPLLMKVEVRVRFSLLLSPLMIVMVAVEDEPSSAAERPEPEEDERRADEGLCPSRERVDLELLPEEQPEAGEDQDPRRVACPPAETDLNRSPRALEREGDHRGEMVGAEDDVRGASEETREEDEHQLLQRTGETRADHAEKCPPMQRAEAPAVAALSGIVTNQGEPAFSVDRADSLGDGQPSLKGMSRDDKGAGVGWSAGINKDPLSLHEGWAHRGAADAIAAASPEEPERERPPARDREGPL